MQDLNFVQIYFYRKSEKKFKKLTISFLTKRKFYWIDCLNFNYKSFDISILGIRLTFVVNVIVTSTFAHNRLTIVWTWNVLQVMDKIKDQIDWNQIFLEKEKMKNSIWKETKERKCLFCNLIGLRLNRYWNFAGIFSQKALISCK